MTQLFEKIFVEVGVSTLVLIALGFGALIDLIRNPLNREWKFRRDRTLNWLVIGLAKGFQTAARFAIYAMNTVMGRSILFLGIFEFGWLLVTGFAALTIGSITAGSLLDRVGAKHTLTTGLGLQVLITILFGLLLHFYAQTQYTAIGAFFFFGLTCFLQTMSNITMPKVSSQWFHLSELPTVVAVIGSCTAIGYALAFGGLELIAHETEISVVFFTMAGLLMLALFLNVVIVKESPLPQSGANSSERLELLRSEDVQRDSISHLLKSGTLWSACVAYLFLGCVRESLFVWIWQYAEYKFLIISGSLNQLLIGAAITIGSVLSVVVAASVTTMKNIYFGSALCMLVSGLCILGIILGSEPWVMMVFVMLVSACNETVVNLGQMIGMRIGGQHLSGSATGIIDASFFVGAALSSLVFAIVLQNYSYSTFTGFFYAMIGCTCLATLTFCCIGLVHFLTSRNENYDIIVTPNSQPTVRKASVIGTRTRNGETMHASPI